MLDTIEKETGAQPGAAVIVLHGLGADGNDFVPFASELDLAAVGPMRFIFPHAPVIPVSINGGYPMRAWYDILTTDLVRREDEVGLRRSQRQVEELIDREVGRGIPSERIVLAGFSQGCAMSLLTGLRYPSRLAGILGMSGYLPLAATTATERHAANAATPVLLAHGRFDDIVQIDRAIASRDALQSLGYAVEWRDYPMPHSVCLEEVQDVNRWLLAVLARRG